MGGQEGSRGYIYQGISAIFSSFIENDWSNISVEYKTKNDKVDIALLSDDESVMQHGQVNRHIFKIFFSERQNYVCLSM
ncbi:MAG: hypothetical protein K6G76_06805 [Lachnospiraceae bacterium]|nr:hypothetical protein [Lachnospiraceae bacterium]